MTILITGSSGKTAAYLAQTLAADKRSILVASRSPKKDSPNPSVRFDWLDESTWELPFSHERSKSSPITSIYLVSPDIDEARAKVIPFVKYAKQKGVNRFTLLSAWENPEGGPLLGGVHAELKALGGQGIDWAVLRPHFFMENFLESYHLESIKSESKIYTCAGDGKKPFISAKDIAATGRQTLIDEKPHNTDHIITGGESLSYDEVAAIFSEVLGRKVEHVKLSEDKFEKLMLKYGMTDPMAKYMTELDVRVSKGEGKDPTNNVKAITGQAPRTFKEFVVDNKAVWA
ncbi:hypothetical protein M409DRAFT_64025 [Zasmidium cellare ATCC 36951]|uniref:NmrA-like domain-containing protein n=1 Tax=Zasmidium cellare ATCC 36951 TaxID=1080233 RepID=A0A6A6CVI4_ZASCE|nr:uncharacterized protein M409DRAFT_64025 [Zasmidium cellare ATCC 36951]KAF2171045.1 hypothetical protein M409DRAFT_64025 [Zasmidium cellare ATCC 36951]